MKSPPHPTPGPTLPGPFRASFRCCLGVRVSPGHFRGPRLWAAVAAERGDAEMENASLPLGDVPVLRGRCGWFPCAVVSDAAAVLGRDRG